MEDSGFRFYPQTLGTAVLSYVKNPPDISWGYDIDGNGRPVYNPNELPPLVPPQVVLTAQPVWDDVAMFEIISRALSLIGVNLQSQAISQYAELIKREGQ